MRHQMGLTSIEGPIVYRHVLMTSTVDSSEVRFKCLSTILNT